MELSFIYISTPHALAAFAKQWAKEKVLAIDLECENNLHHYGAYLSIIQLSTPAKVDLKTKEIIKPAQNFIIDLLAIKDKKDRQPIIDVLADPKIEVIFHDYSFDFRIIGTEFDITPQKLFDTQAAAQLLGDEKISLGDLIEKYIGVKLEKGFQKADWTERPVPENMLTYAVQDTFYLIELKNKLEAELKKKKRFKWLCEELKLITGQKWKNPDLQFTNLKGVKSLDEKERAIAYELYQLRDKFAEELDKPAHYVLSNKFLKDLACRPPPGISGWKRLRLHPKVKAKANLWDEAVQIGKKKTFPIETPERKKFSIQQKKLLEEIEGKRNKVALELGINGHLIANKLQMIEYTASPGKVADRKKIFRDWQSELLF